MARQVKEDDPVAAFADESITGINIIPIDVEPPKMKGIRLQTDKLSFVNRRLQSLETKEMEMQADAEADLGAVDPVVDEATLIEFLRTVVPRVEEELEAALQSISIFDAYEPVWENMDPKCEMVQELWQEGNIDRQVTSVVWNSTGSMLACSYGDLNTTGLAFHPKHPATLAGGTYNGELMLWNTASTDLDLLVASSSIDDYFHREAIEAVAWIQADLSGKDDAFLIATVSGDGKVLIWDARENDLSYPSRGFLLLGAKKRILGGRSLSFSPLDPWLFVVGCEAGTVMRAFRAPPGASMPKPQGQYSWKPSAVALLDQLVSNSRLQLQHHVENYCRTAGKKEVTAEVVFQSKPDPATIFPAPKTTDLEPHHGPVVCAAFSPFHRKLLLTGSTDGSVKMYDVHQQRALYTFYPPTKQISACAISAISWSSARPCVFAVAVEMGGVFVYDLLQSRQEPVLQLPATGSGSQRPLSIAFNPKQRGLLDDVHSLLAVADDTGHVRVFRLPFKLSMQQKDEVGFINRIMASRKGTE